MTQKENLVAPMEGRQQAICERGRATATTEFESTWPFASPFGKIELRPEQGGGVARQDIWVTRSGDIWMKVCTQDPVCCAHASSRFQGIEVYSMVQ